jgi:hypothetical protein
VRFSCAFSGEFTEPPANVHGQPRVNEPQPLPQRAEASAPWNTWLVTLWDSELGATDKRTAVANRPYLATRCFAVNSLGLYRMTGRRWR